MSVRNRASSRDSRTLSLDDDGLDPHIREELEQLNSTSEEINTLEKELEDIRQNHRLTLTEYAQRQAEKIKQHKRSIRKARAFHTASDEAKEALAKAQEAAHKYHNVVDIYNAAKETIDRAESTTFDGEKRREFDAALQEMLNHATTKLNEAKEEKIRSQVDHDQKAQAYREAQQRVDFLAKKFKSSIAKSRPYYEIKATSEKRLKEFKAKVIENQEKLSEAKMRYRQALMHLETISESIHEKRELKATLDAQRRGIGVGAETTQEFEELEVINLDLPDDDSVSDAGSLDSDRHLAEMKEQPHQPNPIPVVSRRVSGCSDSEVSSARRSSVREDGESKSTLPELRERGDGLSPVSAMSSEEHLPVFEVNTMDDVDGHSKVGGTDVGPSSNKSESDNQTPLSDDKDQTNETNFEHSEESGFADASSSEVSEIDVDELLEEEPEAETMSSLEARTPSSKVSGDPPGAPSMKRKTLKKLIPDMDKDEIWL
ncbi:putative SH3 domain-binding protein 5 [Apostichopus japonicus]|uniref:Putative SH3 domain-binding protein 5 n=1 Tax=Stichopus japonicus TaxID=307972 RepID=A0A2G8LQD3_STIJA|nr:putative SH3 domain-binding protein 5 [Apostichopus japonicus]